MSLNRYDAATDGNQKDVVDAVRACGISCEIIRWPCDLACGWDGKTYLYELKVEGKRKITTKKQKEMDTEWRGHFKVVCSAQEIVDDIRGPSRIRGD